MEWLDKLVGSAGAAGGIGGTSETGIPAREPPPSQGDVRPDPARCSSSAPGADPLAAGLIAEAESLVDWDEDEPTEVHERAFDAACQAALDAADSVPPE